MFNSETGGWERQKRLLEGWSGGYLICLTYLIPKIHIFPFLQGRRIHLEKSRVSKVGLQRTPGDGTLKR